MFHVSILWMAAGQRHRAARLPAFVARESRSGILREARAPAEGDAGQKGHERRQFPQMAPELDDETDPPGEPVRTGGNNRIIQDARRHRQLQRPARKSETPAPGDFTARKGGPSGRLERGKGPRLSAGVCKEKRQGRKELLQNASRSRDLRRLHTRGRILAARPSRHESRVSLRSAAHA